MLFPQMPKTGQVYEHRAVRRLLVDAGRAVPRKRSIGEHAGGGPYRAGDLIGFSGNALSSAAVCLLTYGLPRFSLSHVGIIAEYNGELLIFESALVGDFETPCAIQGRCVSGVQAHEIEPRIASYDGKVWHYPLTRPLYAHELGRLTRYCLESIGKGYDEIGAIRAGGFAFSAIESLLHPAGKHAVFCSEFVAACHNEIGLFPTGNVARWNPNHLVRRERFLGVVGRPRRIKKAGCGLVGRPRGVS